VVTRFVVVIPARYESSRLPGKPLLDILGVPMIVRTHRQVCQAVPAEQVYVATDHPEIQRVCEAEGAQVLMTSKACLTGTDRLAECLEMLPDVDVLINVQGDEPVFNPDDLRKLIQAVQRHPHDVINGYCPIQDEALFRSGNIPKVVFRPDGRLLYMSRAAVPSTKALAFQWAHRQVCCYAFPVKALRAFAACQEKTPLEALEDIEILRFLELGFEVRMIPMSSDSVAVDVPEDLERVKQVLEA
jgi:3-deoxy-manno-octulosonate cytidylyltransferase (CMP-KDO synthetase)